MTTLREAAQQALEALEVIDKEFRKHGRQHWPEAVKARVAIPVLRAALAEPQIDPVDEYRKGFIAGQIDMRDREQAEPVQEPTGKDSLQVEQAIAETATTQQQVEQTRPSEYRRGYWAGFEIGKREGRIEAEDALAEPVQEPVAWALHTGTKQGIKWNRKVEHGTPLYTAPPQRKEQRLAELADPTPLEDVVTHGSAWSKGGKRIDPMSVYAEPVQERNFCPRCGKRTNDIHTCTPPGDQP